MPSASLSAEEVDVCAASAAELARRLEALRGDLAAALQGEDPAVVESLTAQIQTVNQPYGEHLQQLRAVIQEVAAAVATRGGATRAERMEFQGEAFTFVSFKLHKYHPLTGESSGGSGFIAWLRTVVQRKWISKKRSERARLQRAPEVSPDVQQAVASAAEQQPIRRALPDRFSERDEAILRGMAPELRSLLLFVSGLRRLSSEELRNTLRDWPTPNEWMLTLSSLERASIYVLEIAEKAYREALALKEAPSTDQLQDFEARAFRAVAQRLLRNYWKLLECETAWQHILAYIEPQEEPLTRWYNRAPQAEHLATMMFFNLWMAFSSPSSWFQLLHGLDVRNVDTSNFLRCFAETNLETRLSKCLSFASASDFAKLNADSEDLLELTRDVQSGLHLVDLPLPFERRVPPLKQFASE